MLESHKINGTVWDCKQTILNKTRLLYISCIYDGFKVYAESQGKLEEIINFQEHKTIVYGVDVQNKGNRVDVVSCSFYDNLICFWDSSVISNN